MKYSKEFTRDFNWFLSVRHFFTFDGRNEYFFKRQGYVESIFKYDPKGLDAKKAFLLIDSQGKSVLTKHPNILSTLLKVKGSINLHIKMYAEDRARGYLPKIEFEKICKEINALDWFIEAVENQKNKYYE